MRSRKRLICAALVLLIALFGALAEEGGGEPIEAPVETTVETHADEPVETPAEVPAETPSETPAEQPSETPAEQPAETPAEQPAESPSETPAEQPAESPSETPAEQPAETPAEQPSDTPAETPSETPAESPMEQPAETPAEQPAEQPSETPAETPAEQPAETPAEQPAESPSETPAEQPAETPAEQPSETPAETPSETPAEVPAETPSETPAEQPSETPAEQPTETPAEQPAETPAETPGETPAEDPTEAPAETTLDIASFDIAVDALQGATRIDDTYLVTPGEPASITFVWSSPVANDAFRVRIQDAQGALFSEATQLESTSEQSIGGLEQGQYVFSVEVISADSVVAEGRYAFAIAYGEASPGEDPSGEAPPEDAPGSDEQPGDKPHGGGFPGGGMPSGGFGGSRPSGAKIGGASGGDAAQGFQITAGKALTSSHVSGTGDMRLYGSVALELPDSAITQLAVGDAPFGIELDDGSGAFNVRADGDRLCLASESSGTAWTLNGSVMKALLRSGITTIEFRTGAVATEFPTDPALSGSVYARLRAEGIASSDYTYTVTAEGVTVSVAGRDYRIGTSNELLPIEG